MTLPLSEQALVGVADLVAEIRTANSWHTEAGGLVVLSPLFPEMHEDIDWQTLVYIASEQYGRDGAGIQGNMREYPVALTINVAAYSRFQPGDDGRLAEKIKSDLRRAMLPASGRLLYAGAGVGSILLLSTALIPDLIQSGIVGVVAQVVVKYSETVTH